MKPILIVSPEICACAAGAAPNMAAVASVHAAESFFSFNIDVSFERKWKGGMGSDAQVFVQALHARRQLGLAELLDHMAMLHDQKAVGEGRGEAEILLDHD